MKNWTLIGATIVLNFAMCWRSACGGIFFEGSPKWGNSSLGSGATVTWSLIPHGTEVIRPPSMEEPFIFQEFWPGTSNLNSVYAQLDADAMIGEMLFRTALLNAFETWSGVADIRFEEVADAGVPLGYSGATAGVVGDIRIGAWSLADPFDAAAAHAFEPPGGTSPLAYFLQLYSPSTFGDISLNTNAFFSTFPGIHEGDYYGGFPNDLESLLIHEVGHSLGLTHSDNVNSIMYIGLEGSEFLQRTLGSDDVANIQQLYGPAPVTSVPEPDSILLFGFGLIAWVIAGRRCSPM